MIVSRYVALAAARRKEGLYSVSYATIRNDRKCRAPLAAGSNPGSCSSSLVLSSGLSREGQAWRRPAASRLMPWTRRKPPIPAGAICQCHSYASRHRSIMQKDKGTAGRVPRRRTDHLRGLRSGSGYSTAANSTDPFGLRRAPIYMGRYTRRNYHVQPRH